MYLRHIPRSQARDCRLGLPEPPRSPRSQVNDNKKSLGIVSLAKGQAKSRPRSRAPTPTPTRTSSACFFARIMWSWSQRRAR
jgi:hypothetical protein